MNYWLYSANPKIYDVFGAFQQTEVAWPINSNIAPGDRVYFYLSAPYKHLGFAATVLETIISKEKVYRLTQPFVIADSTTDTPCKNFMCLAHIKALSKEEAAKYSFARLKENGLNGSLMGPRKLNNNPTLLNYALELPYDL